MNIHDIHIHNNIKSSDLIKTSIEKSMLPQGVTSSLFRNVFDNIESKIFNIKRSISIDFSNNTNIKDHYSNDVSGCYHSAIEEPHNNIRNTSLQIKNDNNFCAVKHLTFLNFGKIYIFNFDDDTFRPVVVQNENLIPIIESWYETCNIDFDCENTNYFMVAEKHILGELMFNDINIKHKERFISLYLPLILTEYEIKQTIEMEDSLIYPNIPKKNTNKPSFTKTTQEILDHLKIKLPEKIKRSTDISNNKTQNANYINKNIGIENYFPMDVDNDNNNMFEPLFNDCEIKPYNTCYNALFTKFSLNAKNLDDSTHLFYDDLTDNCLELANKHITVIINYKYLHTLVLKNPTTEAKKILDTYIEYGFIELFSVISTNKEIETIIDTNFNNKRFLLIEEINESLLITSKYIDISQENIKQTSINPYTHEENYVKTFLANNYIIDDNLDHKIKASVLCDIISKNLIININSENSNSFRNRLSKYLFNLGLKKKRFNDGFYYYGLKPITTDSSQGKIVFNLNNNWYNIS
jgi:hypothetical protein